MQLTGRTLASRAARANNAFVPSTSTLITASYRTDRRTTASDGKRELGGPLLEEPALLHVGHRLRAGVCAELVVDVVEMVAERLR